MNTPQLALRVASVISGLISLAHVLRLLAHIDVTIGAYQIGLWPSGVAALVAAALSVWFWRRASTLKRLRAEP